MNLKIQLRKKAFSLVELLVTVSIFSGLGIVLGMITNSFVDVYMKSRDQSDLQRISTALMNEIARGDNQLFDGLGNAAEIIEATEHSISFVPHYRESSLAIGEYAVPYSSLTATVNQEGGPPRINGTYQGGMRIQYNPQKQKYELRYYLSKHPRAGSEAPVAYIKRLGKDRELSESSGENIQEAVFEPIPVRFVWQTPISAKIPRSYVVFTGGWSPLEFDGDEFIPPDEASIRDAMKSNEAQLFPDPFEYPEDILTFYYQPEIEPSLISGQDSLIAHLFFKNESASQPTRFNIIGDALSKYNEQIHSDSLLLSYDRNLVLLPTDAALINANLKYQRPQFLTTLPDEAGSSYRPSTFSYSSTRNSTEAMQTEEREYGAAIPLETLQNVTLVNPDFLILIGSTLERSSWEQISKRNFSHIIPLDTITYTQAFQTHASSIDSRLGFQKSNCLPGGDQTRRCRLISRSFPSGKEFLKSKSLFISNLVYDSSVDNALTGTLSAIIYNRSTLRSYVVRVNFTTHMIYIIKKQSYNDVEPAFDGTNDDIMSFPIDNSQFIDFTNLQSTGFLDEDFNYTSESVWDELLDEASSLTMYLEVDALSNLEGFSLTWRPK